MTIFTKLTKYNQWISFKLETRPDGRLNKIPVNFSGITIDAHDSTQWCSYAEAAATGRPLGFVITEADPFFFIDIDNALHDGVWSTQAAQLCNLFSGCFVEISSSGNGLHIIGVGKPADPRHKCDYHKTYGFSVYTKSRFIALTGTGAKGDSGHNAQAALDAILSLPGQTSATADSDWTTEPDPEYQGIDDDERLIKVMIKRAGSVRARFGEGQSASFADLWAGDTDKLLELYPRDNDPGDIDMSRVEATLCMHLAFWTGNDCARIERIITERWPGVRDKWRDREAYRRETILGAVSRNSKVLKLKDNAPEGKDLPEAMVSRDGSNFLTVENQLRFFADMVYVAEQHAILRPNGELAKPEQFSALYGGWLFALDAQCDKTVDTAWKAVMNNKAYMLPRADRLAFEPRKKFQEIFEWEKIRYVNSYIPIDIPSVAGDASLFLRHVMKLFPDPMDQEVLLSYMAAVAQYPGVKFKWAPIIQGVQGNGKTLLLRIMQETVGERYTFCPGSADLSATGGGFKFNKWLEGKLLIALQELDLRDHPSAVKAMLDMIDAERIQIQGKGADQKMTNNCANFVIIANDHPLPIKTVDRRYAPLDCAQQTVDDLERDGMLDPQYFERMFQWLEKENGFAITTNYLQNFRINPHLNPAQLCKRAPKTSARSNAIKRSLSVAAQEIFEATEEGRPGFCGGWISSVALAELRKRPLSVRAYKLIMDELGYIPHPALPDGRATRKTVCDQMRKPRLYIKKGHINEQITDVNKVMDAYVSAQLNDGALNENQNIFDSSNEQ